MKKLHYVSSKLIVAALAGTLLASAALQARPADNARLVVSRSADFGLEESVNLSVDGVAVATLAINQSYDAALPAGKHVLSVTTIPRLVGQQSPTPVALVAEPGKTYSFTAIWKDAERPSLAEQ